MKTSTVRVRPGGIGGNGGIWYKEYNYSYYLRAWMSAAGSIFKYQLIKYLLVKLVLYY